MTTEELNDSPDFYFKSNVYDLLVLLGCKPEVAKLVRKVLLDKPATVDETKQLMQYNIEHFGLVKGRLFNLTTIKITPE